MINLSSIKEITASLLSNGKYQIDAVLNCGKSIIIKKQSTRIPAAVQLYSVDWINGNHNDANNPLGGHFTFAKNVSSLYKQHHIRSFKVTAK